jgi:O-antigen ligase
VGLFGLYVFSFGIFYKKAEVENGLIFMALAVIFKIRLIRTCLIKTNLFLMAIIFFLFVSARAISAALEFKEYHELIMNRAILYGCTFFWVLLVSYWMGKARGQWDYLLIAMMTGFLSQILREENWTNVTGKAYLYWAGAERIAFGSPASVYGLWCAIILLACLLLYRHIWGSPEYKWGQAARIFLWTAITSVSAMGVIFSQSRSAWIGSVLISLPLTIYYLYRRQQIKLLKICGVAGFLILILFLTNFPLILKSRLLETNYYEVIFKESDGDATSGLDGSITERLFMYNHAWKLWKKYPFLGYGPGVSAIQLRVIKDTYPNNIGFYDHFHNFVLDILIQLGFIGLTFYGLFFYEIIQQLVRNRQKAYVDLDFFLFVLGSFALIAISCLTDQPLNHTKGLYIVVFLGGICYSSKFLTESGCRSG